MLSAYHETSCAMRNKDVATVRRLLTHARYEVLPTPTIEAKVLEVGALRPCR